MSQPIALVTGGARRIGKAICQHLARKGCFVYIHFNTSEDSAQALKQELCNQGYSAEIIQGDLQCETDVVRIIDTINKQVGRLNMLVNNAAIFPQVSLPSIQADAAISTWKINCLAPLLLIQRAQSLLNVDGADAPGAVVNLIDNRSVENSYSHYSSYSSSKAGLMAITRSLAVELAPNIRVNAVGPGAILFNEHESRQQQQKILHQIPMQRVGTPEEIAETVYFLLTGPKYITGQLILVDGGWNLY